MLYINSHKNKKSRLYIFDKLKKYNIILIALNVITLFLRHRNNFYFSLLSR